MDWYLARGGGIPVSVSWVERDDSSPGSYARHQGESSLDSTRREEFNGIELKAVACL